MLDILHATLTSPVTVTGPLLLAAALEVFLAEEAALVDSAARAKNYTRSNACRREPSLAVAGRKKRNTRASKRVLAA